MADNTTVKLYFVENLTEEKNFVIENISSFLTHHTTNGLTLTGMQYQRLESSKTLKINKPQSWASIDPASLNVFPNYCSIDNGESPSPSPHLVAYYFIVGIRQRAQNTVELSLELDVLNTFGQRWESLFTSKTRVIREHSDRFKAVYEDTEDKLRLFPIFSRTDEGETPKLVLDGAGLTPIQDKKGGTSDVSFYLIYRTDEDGRPCVDLSASKQLLIGTAGSPTPYVLLASEMVIGRYYYLMGSLDVEINGTSQHVHSDNTADPPTDDDYGLSGDGMFVFWKLSNGYIAVNFVSDDDNLSELTGEWWDPSAASFIDRYHWYADRGITINQGQTLYYSNNLSYDQEEIKTFSHVQINAGGTNVYLAPLSVLDLTDGNNVKVIECPYCPISYSYDALTQVYAFQSGKFPSVSPEGFLRSYDVGQIEFLNEGIAAVQFSEPFNYHYTAANQTSPKGTFKDPKAFTTPYYFPVFVYDSFAQIIKFEDMRPKSSATYREYTAFNVNYKQSSAISSNLLFEIVLDSTGFEIYRRDENFAHILPASRNNEVPLYSSAYLEYIKNGYNYDKKKLKDTMAQNAAISALQLLGSVLSFALAGPTGGLSAVAGVGLASSAVSSMASQAASYKQASADLEQKVNLLKAQSFTVSGIDDLDLFKRYGKNRLLQGIYHMQEAEADRIEAKFYFTGYATQRTGAPRRSRLYFDFYQAEADFDPKTLVSAGLLGQIDEYLDQIKAKVAAGVTFFWFQGLAINSYSLVQDKENIELSVLSLLQ